MTVERPAVDPAAIARAREAWSRVGMGPAVTRFAPSPTGELHLGHLLHVAWLEAIAAALDARVIVRMEDHDRERCTPDHERSILDDLDWLGCAFDEVSVAALRSGDPTTFRQSDAGERHLAAFEQLRGEGLLYGCTCTRRDLGPPDASGERHYPGTCRGKPVERPGRSVVRVHLPDGPTTTHDLLLGTLEQDPATEHGDPVIRDAKGQWTYQFAVVVDDLAHGVNLVVRGEDLVTSTGRQQLLGRLLGRLVPVVTAHHPLLLDADGKKLSKRDRSTTVRSARSEA